MEGSKSEENKNPKKVRVQQKTQDFEVAIDIKEPDVEKEIQNIFMSTDKKDDNKPCCSWQNSSMIINVTEQVQPKITDACNEACSDVAVPSLDPNQLQESDNSIATHVGHSKPTITVPSNSSMTEGLFDNIQTIDEPDSSNAPTLSNPPEVPPRTRREIPIVNFPDSSMLQLLQPRQSLFGPPPSYSKSLLDRRINPCASIQFVAPIPPPSYDGVDNELRYVNYTGFTLGLGNTWQFQSQPAYCPVCETVTITRTDVRISRLAHFTALILFFLLCWPFCLLPYFLNVCNYTFHYCSVCHSYLGARRPFQRNQ